MSEAEKKWDDFDWQRASRDSSFYSREAYKAALRREIEKRGKKWAYLQRLETA